MRQELQTIGFEVTEGIGGNSLVGIFHNGDGPTIMLRTDMDALPIEEKTGLPYASVVKSTNTRGDIVPVMHACGHDMHMTVFVGVANTLVKLRKHWKGTLMVIAQQAEEMNGGSIAMINDGIFQKFPIPKYALAFHVCSNMAAGTVGVCSGPFFATVDDVDITVYGKGGHGAYPHLTIDPIVIASRIVLDLQTIVSRKLSPLAPAVVTVGSFKGGTQRNIIPDKVELALTVRSYTDDVRDQILTSIKEIADGAARTAGLPDSLLPTVRVDPNPTPSVINDDALFKTVKGSWESVLGQSNVFTVTPEMVGEDFGRYGRTPEKVPILLSWLGGVDPEVLAKHKANSTTPPPLHSPYFTPRPDMTIRTGVLSMSYGLIELFNQK
jgi:hippurate hydrolase